MDELDLGQTIRGFAAGQKLCRLGQDQPGKIANPDGEPLRKLPFTEAC